MVELWESSWVVTMVEMLGKKEVDSTGAWSADRKGAESVRKMVGWSVGELAGQMVK
jgi:hypothetical protein